MATSEAEICNKALARLGITTFLEDLETDQMEEAQVCRLFYADLRDACLAAFPWPFATKRFALAALPLEAARDGWQYVFAVPSDCLKPRYIWPSGLAVRAPRADQRAPFVIEKASTDDGQVLLCDLDSPVLSYTARVTAVGALPAAFVDALAYLIASEIAMPLTKDIKKAELAVKMYAMKIDEAWASSASSQQEDQPPDSELITGRW